MHTYPHMSVCKVYMCLCVFVHISLLYKTVSAKQPLLPGSQVSEWPPLSPNRCNFPQQSCLVCCKNHLVKKGKNI